MRIDESGTIDKTQPLCEGEATPRLDEASVSLGDGDTDSCTNKGSFARSYIVVFGGIQIQASITTVGVGR